MKNLFKLITGAVLAGLLITSACKKTTTTTNNNGGSPGLLKTMLQITAAGGQNDSITTTLIYDNQNRVVNQIAITKFGSTTLGADTTTYTFGTNSVAQYSSVTGTTITYTLNSSGFRTSDNLGDTWSYNGSGYLTQSFTASTATTTTYTYNASNELATKVATSSSGTNTYTFGYTGSPAAHAGSSWQQGQSAGALFTSDVEVQGGVTTTLTATYTVNAQNVLTESVVTSSASGSAPVYTYYYYY